MRSEEFDLPVGCVTCPLCSTELEVEPGASALETLWQHEYECAAVYVCVPVSVAAA